MRTSRKLKLLAMGSAAVMALSTGAYAQEASRFEVAGGDLKTALQQFAGQSSQEILFSSEVVAGRKTGGVTTEADAPTALAQLLQGTGLTFRQTGTGTLLVVQQEGGSGPQASSAGHAVDALIVTAQKREENIQDVPIAMSAFSQEDLTTRQVAGGADLMTQVPNMTFTKTNFTGYSIQLRGIGTQAISATTDAAVAVAFNNTPFIRNRFFEQEFYDLERVEVLRGPQGTLYGRNATAGVVNIISAKPKFFYEAKASGDIANYNSTRLEGMINIPITEDKVALRVAGAWTKRDGYATNEITGNPIDGRDLWSTRVSLRFEPTDAVSANLIWEHFEEDDDRLRSGKQVCKTHEVTEVAGFPTTHNQVLPEGGMPSVFAGVQGTFSQGCEAASLYAPESFQTPNGLALPYYQPFNVLTGIAGLIDPYASRGQSHDLRVIESAVDPEYRAKTDVAELQLSVDLTDNLTLASETSYSVDTVFSMQDYNRFNTAPGAWVDELGPKVDRDGILTDGPNGSIFCDPQIGCSDRLVALDLSTGESRQFSQEFRLSSDYDGNMNFSLGANFMRYDTLDKYYVFINSFGLLTAIVEANKRKTPVLPYEGGVTDNTECLRSGPRPPNPNAPEGILGCTYMDPNPIGSLNDLGHNYFLSKNPYKLISYAAFGELYYNITENLKLTGGFRLTVDRKQAPLIPSWVLADSTVGYPVAEVVNQEWREPTGRLAIDWKPQLDFTDETLVYASYAHGYKAGGANPPTYGKALYHLDTAEVVIADSVTHPKTFAPEFVDAFEIGTKNTLFDGRMTLNLAAFYYDYEGYQISQIVDRSAANLNYDADIWGLEIEADWRPLDNLRIGFKGGYENTRIADGMRAVDIMDRTAGQEGWVLVRPFPGVPSNCVLPEFLFAGANSLGLNGGGSSEPTLIQIGNPGGGGLNACELAYTFGFDPITQLPYVPDPTVEGSSSGNLQNHPDYPGWDPSTAPNNGEGFFKDLSGNELPNAPNFTATLTADYTAPLPGDWLMTLHTDLYYQSEAWTRIFNTEGYDKLKAYTNINLAAIFTNEDAGWKVMAYVKNVMDRDSITGAFLNSDDSALTTNVFLTEPRLYGIRITKDWTGGSWFEGLGGSHEPGAPYRFRLEVGGRTPKVDAPHGILAPSFIGSFSPVINPVGDQDFDLDRGDERDLKLTYDAGGWRVAAGVRYGRTSGKDREYRSEAGDTGCQATGLPFPPPGQIYVPGFCDTHPNNVVRSTNWSQSEGYQYEEHTVVDFSVGRDAGMGFFGPEDRSELAVGLRYAHLEGTQDVSLYGIPDWDIPSGNLIPGPLLSTAHNYRLAAETERAFEGAGPVVSWDASKKLIGNEDTGHLDLDWSVSGGVLFGRQGTSVEGEETTQDLSGSYVGLISPIATHTTPVDIDRSNSKSVPTFGASVGLSYKIDRIHLGVGYRWERYFDAIDGGYAEQQSYDRTIDGPYFKISAGF